MRIILFGIFDESTNLLYVYSLGIKYTRKSRRLFVDYLIFNRDTTTKQNYSLNCMFVST